MAASWPSFLQQDKLGGGGVRKFVRLSGRLAVCCWLLALSGCVVVPPHDGLARVRVDDVVKRVKCDIAIAVLDKTNFRAADGSYPFVFLKDWAAKLHFTIAVDMNSAINPGATLVRALPPAGSVSQTFSLGLGAGVSTQAVRQEDYEYLISFSDLATEFKDAKNADLYNRCQFEQGILLESELGMSGLVDGALLPIERKVLTFGRNVGPGPTPVPTPASSLKDPVGQLEIIGQRRKNQDPSLATRVFGDNEAADIEKQTQAVITNVVKPLFGIASTSSFEPSCLAQVADAQNKAVIFSINVSENVVRYNASSGTEQSKALGDARNNFKSVVYAARDMIAKYKICANQQWKAAPKIYDPIDLISQTVNFYVTASGSVTPSWKLVNVTAPLAGTFASASRKDTNTLILTMGRPVPTPDGGISASAAMNNQLLSSLLAQAIAQQRLVP